MKYFELSEFTTSEEAEKRGIDNTPEQWQIDNCEEMVNNLIDPLREAWAVYCREESLGTPALKVTSGIRSKALNDALPNASKTSSHFIGYAVDLYPYNGRLKKFKRFAYKWLKGQDYDQMISEEESADGTPRWLHIGYKRYDGSQRRQMLSNVGKIYMPISKV